LRKDTADALRQFQQAANDSGMRIAKFAPGSEIPGEFYSEWPISIEVTGSRQSLGRFFDRINELPQLWLMGKLSFKAVTNQDAASPIRATLTVQAYLLREAESAGSGH
jgi:Tfp pilus assembly protein PilO